MTTEHTPTPWVVDAKPIMGNSGPAIRTVGRHIARMGWNDEEDKANAAFIVRAVNSHDGLLAAVKALLGHSAHKCRFHGPAVCDQCEAQKQARAAIAKAEKED
ncbi:MAG: hypothetical protein Q8O76_06235 [Chloroflexota bacterium]|nr:hypothetical protein [Chloroflexota bacterium]